MLEGLVSELDAAIYRLNGNRTGDFQAQLSLRGIEPVTFKRSSASAEVRMPLNSDHHATRTTSAEWRQPVIDSWQIQADFRPAL